VLESISFICQEFDAPKNKKTFYIEKFSIVKRISMYDGRNIV